MKYLTRGLIVVHRDPLELQVAGALVHPGGVDAVLFRNYFPELWTKKWHTVKYLRR